jgi:F0F1-type ATP synthase beta subunit
MPTKEPRDSATANDNLPEAAFYMVGTIEEAVEKGKKLAAEAA